MYDFTSLSDVDFEFLTRDLLQKELNITLESFTSGRDGGIDLRYSGSTDGTLVVQCKHFAGSKFANLKSVIKTKEADKIKKLKPARYILTTSLGLTPANKTEIFKLLVPYCPSEADIYGREDLNNLLTKFPEVEQAHFKLWLTGAAVLKKILHSAVFNQTEFEIAKITKKLRHYVQNKSFHEALDVLENDHYCIIAGIPGIGKTTLAEVLLVHYISHGYEAFAVGGDIAEAYGVYQKGQKQVFFYDDFLGQTSFEEKFQKNEEQKLLRFIEAIRNSKDARFVLTTREYILNQAKVAYEKLNRSSIDVNKCVISLDKYTAYDKARILYNHLYFSDLPTEYKQALIENQNYRKIIEHENYSPRVIKWMTAKSKELEIDSAKYLTHFIANLDNPVGLWEHAYDYQLSNATQLLMLVLGTLPNEILLEDLSAAFEQYYTLSARKQNFQTGKSDFRNALKEAESNFIHTEKKSDRIIVRFHNPSIRDFIEHRLVSDAQILQELCDGALFYEQLVKLWNLSARQLKRSGDKSDNDKLLFVKDFEKFLNQLQKTITLKGCEIKTFTGLADRIFIEKIFSIENRISFAVRIAEVIFAGDAAAVTFLQPFYDRLRERLDKNLGQKENLISLLIATKKSSFNESLLDEEFLNSAENFLADNFYVTDDFRYFLNFKQEFEDSVGLEDWEAVKEEFVDFTTDEVRSFLSDYKPDSNIAKWWIDELTDLNHDFDVEIDDEIQKLKDFIDEAEDEEPDVKPPKAPEPIGENNTFTDEDITDMFDSLLDK